MAQLNFYDIVNMEHTRISIPHSSHFTMGTSPYYAHQHGLAIDIYHSLPLENYEVFSPVSGVIEKIKTLRAPKPRFIGGIDKDYLTLIRNPRNEGIVYKFLHVKPNGKVGDRIQVGDSMGTTIRNGYFAYWSSPHLHLEVRTFDNAIRASGGIPFSLSIQKENQKFNTNKPMTNRVPLKIHSSYPEFTLAHLPEHLYHQISPIYGAKAIIDETNCILDGGIPHYKIGTIITLNNLNLNKTNQIWFIGTKIGAIDKTRDGFGFFKFDRNLKFFLNSKEIRGISLYLAKFPPLIKLIHKDLKQFSFKPKSNQSLNLVAE